MTVKIIKELLLHLCHDLIVDGNLVLCCCSSVTEVTPFITFLEQQMLQIRMTTAGVVCFFHFDGQIFELLPITFRINCMHLTA